MVVPVRTFCSDSKSISITQAKIEFIGKIQVAHEIEKMLKNWIRDDNPVLQQHCKEFRLEIQSWEILFKDWKEMGKFSLKEMFNIQKRVLYFGILIGQGNARLQSFFSPSCYSVQDRMSCEKESDWANLDHVLSSWQGVNSITWLIVPRLLSMGKCYFPEGNQVIAFGIRRNGLWKAKPTNAYHSDGTGIQSFHCFLDGGIVNSSLDGS